MDTAQGAGSRAAPTSEVIEGLNDLLQLDHDAIGAYEIAIERLKDRDHADQIAGFKRDHERHVRELNEAIAGLGGTAVNEPHATGPLKQALQALGAVGGDKGVLLAWRTNELQVRTKYDDYASRANSWPDNVKRLIDQNALDEERHYQWVVQVLQHMGVSAGEGAAAGVAAQVREKAGDVADSVRETAADAADTVRETAADAVDTVRETAADLAESARAGAATAAESARAGIASAGESARLGVASGIESAAHGLERIPGSAEGATGAQARVGDAAHRVAGGMESTADYLRRADATRVRADAERQIRNSPVQSVLVLFAAGFVIGRILR